MVTSIALVALVTSGCGLMRIDSGPDVGPEQFNFVIDPGSGVSAESADAVASLSDGVIEDANHVGSVVTPLGKTDIYTYTQVNADGNWTCQAVVHRNGGSSSCGQGPAESPGAGEIRIGGVGTTDDWATLELSVGDGIRSVVVTADDGTDYRTNVFSGFAMVVYPVSRGRVVAQGFGGSEQPVGDPVIVESIP